MASSSDSVKQAARTQKWVLRVPVDCEGCRKKVTKIVRTISGVESCEVDIKQQKVVVTGNVDVGTLLKTLAKKTGKHAELWPEEKTRKKKKKAVRDEAVENRAEERRVSNCEEESAKVMGNSETSEGEEEKNSSTGAEGLDAPSPAEAVIEKKVRVENKKKSKGQNGKENIHFRVESPPVEDKDIPPPPINNAPPLQHNSATSAKVNGQSSSPQAAPPPNHVPPRHPIPSTSPPVNETTARNGPSYSYHHPHPQPQPVYTVSYSAAPQPQTSQTAVQRPRISDPPRPPHPGLRQSYYYPHPQQPVYTMSYNVAPPPQTSSYGNQGSSGAYDYRMYRPYDDEVDYDAHRYGQQQTESFGMFSDENPNACIIM